MDANKIKWSEIVKMASTLEISRGSLGDRIDEMVDSARVNADDTVYLEKAAAESDYDMVAISTLELILSDSNDEEAKTWFKSIGFNW
jgi:hypothetical protein